MGNYRKRMKGGATSGPSPDAPPTPDPTPEPAPETPPEPEPTLPSVPDLPKELTPEQQEYQNTIQQKNIEEEFNTRTQNLVEKNGIYNTDAWVKWNILHTYIKEQTLSNLTIIIDSIREKSKQIEVLTAAGVTLKTSLSQKEKELERQTTDLKREKEEAEAAKAASVVAQQEALESGQKAAASQQKVLDASESEKQALTEEAAAAQIRAQEASKKATVAEDLAKKEAADVVRFKQEIKNKQTEIAQAQADSSAIKRDQTVLEKNITGLLQKIKKTDMKLYNDVKNGSDGVNQNPSVEDSSSLSEKISLRVENAKRKSRGGQNQLAIHMYRAILNDMSVLEKKKFGPGIKKDIVVLEATIKKMKAEKQANDKRMAERGIFMPSNQGGKRKSKRKSKRKTKRKSKKRKKSKKKRKTKKKKSKRKTARC